MASMVIWVVGIGLSVAVLVVTAAMKQFYLHMAIAAIVSIGFALVSHSEVRAIGKEPGGSEQGIAVALRHMGYVWAWGALGLIATYAFGVLTWREWWQFCIAFALLAGLSLFLASALRTDATSGVVDPLLIKVARGFALFVLIAMIITMAGLLIDGKMWRFFTVPGQKPNSQDWGATKFFFFGALALVLISGTVVRLTGAQQAKAA
jgi:hypothetical protein